MDTNAYGFRTSVGGFHKGDVSRYIAETAGAHQAETAELQARIDDLTPENQSLRDQIDALTAENQDLQARLEALTAEKQALEAQLAERPQEPVSPVPEESVPEAPEKPEKPEAPVPELEPGSLQAKELAAYRRAEAAERLAYQRAGLLYLEMESICQDSTTQMAQLDTDAQTALDLITGQLEVLRQSLAATHETIHTASQTLKDISDMVPDPAEGLEVDV